MSKKDVRYKAIMFDIDGTLVRNGASGNEECVSPKVVDAVKKAKRKISVGIISGRTTHSANFILDQLPLTAPCVVSGGAQIFDPVSRKILWEQPLVYSDYLMVLRMISLMNKKTKVLVEDGTRESTHPEDLMEKPLSIYLPELDHAGYVFVKNALSKFPSIVATECVTSKKNCFSFHITHSMATKKQGILKVAELMSISNSEVIGVGDGYNDFPLFNACGLKVAVGNAVSELKAQADYIAPDVEDDAAAHVIERFAFNKRDRMMDYLKFPRTYDFFKAILSRPHFNLSLRKFLENPKSS